MAGWIVAPPREALEEQRQTPMAMTTAVLAGVSALFNAALSETVLAPASAGELAAVSLSYFLAFSLFVSVLHQISRLFAGDAPGWGVWFRAGVIVILPAHLLAPAALLAQPFGASGLIFYEAAKLALLSFMIRRSAWAVQALLRWPLWASILLTLSPLVLGALGILMAMSLLIFGLFAAALAFLL